MKGYAKMNTKKVVASFFYLFSCRSLLCNNIYITERCSDGIFSKRSKLVSGFLDRDKGKSI